MNNRIIKFREFIHGQFHYWGFTEEGIFKGPATPSLTRGQHSQFTGLPDKHGVEIWEGDVVKDSSPWNWIVRFGECRVDGNPFIGWYLEHPEREDFNGPFSKDDVTVLEVVGNIYQSETYTPIQN